MSAKRRPSERFWGLAGELHWFKPFTRCSNGRAVCQVVRRRSDQHLVQLPGRPSGHARGATRPALIWEGEPGEVRVLTYQMLHAEVCKFANVLKTLGIGRGDVVSMYMPLVPELAIAMLACARIGAVHRWFSPASRPRPWPTATTTPAAKLHDHGRRRLAARQADAAEGKRRRGPGQVAHGREVHGAAADRCRRGDAGRPRLLVARPDGRRLADCPAEPLDSETPLFILYTSGSTGKPKGIMHTTAGYNLFVKKTIEWVFDLRDDDIYWCTADIGWVTGHSYVVYGPLSAGATTLMYEGRPTGPTRTASGRSSRSTASASSTRRRRPSAPSSSGATSGVDSHDLSSLRLLGSGGRRDQSRGLDVVSPARSAAAAARSSIPGGRPRPAGS